ncbi:tetratricopeptide repeat protein [Paenibacillus athensensis]|uniref:Glycosyltransferase 2-like domain-containing protein n=1 Tax=Paenibacillus athensensis TaxID=1967502 RepID=A0A4Y8QBM0_9BACL|nr:tetratricopeptide repeat protein [Paenibacillus athensensis]MCD1259109.1 tetratricopeptide repeat protein [Paenibacillus athensensis]
MEAALNYEPVRKLFQAKRFREAEEPCKQLVRANPLDAQSWVLLAEALLHQGFGRAARRLFERAWLLDPQAIWVEAAKQALGRTPDGDERFDIEGLLHVPRVTITAAVLAGNEEQSIADCLLSLEGAVDEIVVFATGADRTAEIAGQIAGVRVVPLAWQDHFAATRNEAMTYLHTDWVIWFDADERLLPEDASCVREAAGVFHTHPLLPVLHIWHLNKMRDTVVHDFSQVRLFPLRPGVRYWGRVHEQVGTNAGLYADDTYRRPVKIRYLHDGYDPDVVVRTGKLERNLRLLRLMLDEEPDNPGHWLFYGRESLLAGLDEEAERALLEALRLAAEQPRFGRVLDIYNLLVQLSMKRGNWEEAERWCREALEVNPDFPDAFFWLAQVQMKQAEALYREAEKGVRQAQRSLATYRGGVTADYRIGAWMAEMTLADIAFRSGKWSEARKLYARHMHRPEAQQLALKRLAWMDKEGAGPGRDAKPGV